MIKKEITKIMSQNSKIMQDKIDLKLKFTLWDYFIMWIPDFLVTSPQTRIFKQVTQSC